MPIVQDELFVLGYVFLWFLVAIDVAALPSTAVMVSLAKGRLNVEALMKYPTVEGFAQFFVIFVAGN